MVAFQENNLDIGGKLVWTMAPPHEIPKNELPPFVVNEAGLFNARDQFFSKREGRAGYLLLHTRDGKGVLNYEEGRYELSPGSIVLVNCFNAHEYRTLHEEVDDWKFYWVHFECDNMMFFDRMIYQGSLTAFDVKDKLVDDFEKILDYLPYADQESLLLVSDSVYKILMQMVGASIVERTPGKKEIDNKMTMKRAADYIKVNYWKPLSLDEIAQHFQISKYHFLRLFKENIGTTPYNYMIVERINMAKKLLQTTDLKVQEISIMVGLSDESHFTRTFKSVTGVSPTAYRANG